MLSIKVDTVKCDGCSLCQLACSFAHMVLNTETGGQQKFPELPDPLLWVKVCEEEIQIDICRHCENPPCADACVAGAFKVDMERGIVGIDQQKCVGCWSCVMECPFGAIRICSHSDKECTLQSRAFKCDGCSMWDKPLCASFCPTGAVQIARNNNGAAAIQRRERAALLQKGLSLGAARYVNREIKHRA